MSVKFKQTSQKTPDGLSARRYQFKSGQFEETNAQLTAFFLVHGTGNIRPVQTDICQHTVIKKT